MFVETHLSLCFASHVHNFNIVRMPTINTAKDTRFELKNKNFVLWILGPTSSGKTTIGKMLVDEMRAKNIPAIHYDGDEIRSFFGKTLGFEAQERLRAVSICAHLANKASDAGLNSVVSALTANDDARDYISNNVSSSSSSSS